MKMIGVAGEKLLVSMSPDELAVLMGYPGRYGTGFKIPGPDVEVPITKLANAIALIRGSSYELANCVKAATNMTEALGVLTNNISALTSPKET